MSNIDILSNELLPIESINFDNGNSKDAIFNQLYKYLYGFCDKNYIIRLINDHNVKGYSGFCTNKWLEETVAIKCYDCEYDGTCAICLDCFFDSNHTGHEFRLTRTSGGCCDCGDVSSWDVKGSCSTHTNFAIFDEKRTLEPFTNGFLIRLENLINYIINHISDYLHNINIVNGETLQILVLFLNDLANITPAYRYAMNLSLSTNVLKDWMLRHQILPNDLQKAFNSLYLTMITSISFKRKFASLFASLYIDIVQPLKEIPDDWHLSNLSVQLFTYSNIAFDLVRNSFMDSCIDPIVEKSLIDKRLNTLQFNRFDRKKFNLYIRIISDLTYLINHTSVCHILLEDTKLQNTIFNLFWVHNYMNMIERETNTHVSFENTGYSIAFTVEHSLHSAFKPLSDYIKALDETNIPILLKFYKNFNDFIKKNALSLSFNSDKFARTFHIPLIRFFTSVIDFNLIRRSLKAYLSNMASNDPKLCKYLNKSFPNLKSDETLYIDILQLFDNDVLKYVLKASIDVLKFAMEIKHNLWVYNGETMHDQRTTYYELLFDTFDIASIQMCVVLLGMKNIHHNFDVLSFIFDICFDLDHFDQEPLRHILDKFRNSVIQNDEYDDSSINQINMFVDNLLSDIDPSVSAMYNKTKQEDEEMIEEYLSDADDAEIDVEHLEPFKSGPGDFEFNINFFYILLNTIINDIKHLEIQSMSRKTTKDWFVNRGHPILLMDIVYSLASGNVEFGHIVKETKKVWKHHPLFIETIEQVAMFNYSKVSDKTYIRLKPESYKYIDIIWNTQNPTTHLVSKEALNHDISLLGSPDSDLMSPEYIEAQCLILNSISCNMLFNYLLLVLTYFCKIGFKLESTDFASLTDMYSICSSNPNKFEQARNMLSASKYKFNSCTHTILYTLKILNLLFKKLPLPSDDTGVLLVSCMKSMLKTMDDDVYTKCTNYTLNLLNNLYSFKNNVEKMDADNAKRNIKLLQRQFLQRISTQQSMFTVDTDLDENAMDEDDKSMICILCKTSISSASSMSTMCFISSNNVLRRCCSSDSCLDSSDKNYYNYGVYAKCSMPLKSSIITSCGHIAHTSCIQQHRKIQSDTQLFSLIGFQRLPNEFFCPICKSLCNFTLKMVPDSLLEYYQVNGTENMLKDGIKSYIEGNGLSVSTFGSMFNISRNRPVFNDEDQVLTQMGALCESSWRYPYSSNWIASPVYSKHEQYPQFLYALNVLSTNKNINYFLNTDVTNKIDELNMPFNKSLRNIECDYCSKFDLETMDLDSFNCFCFKNQDYLLLPIIKPHDTDRICKIETIYTYFIKRWDYYKSTNLYNCINMKSSEFDYTEMFPRALTSSYTMALFSNQRTYFGINNWRHVNSTASVDPKFWLLYNEMLRTTSIRRNILNIPNSLYSQIVRNLYFSAIQYSEHYAGFSLENILQYNIKLDKTYHDTKDANVSLPDISLYDSNMLDKHTNMLRLFIESLNDSNLTDLYAVCLENDSTDIDISYYDERIMNSQFFENVQNSNHVMDGIKTIKPLKHYLYGDEQKNPYKLFANDLMINPWSVDYIREFLLHFLSSKDFFYQQVKTYLYYYMVVATLQLVDRFIIDIIREDYEKFVDERCASDASLMKTRIKRDFIIAYNERFFNELFQNSDFPCDVKARCMFMDFKQNVESFKSYNLKSVKPEVQDLNLYDFDIDPTNLCSVCWKKDYENFNHIISELIMYASMMKSIHQKHLESLTEPIPYESISYQNGSISIDQDVLDNYLFNQVSRIIRVREIHNNINNNHEVNRTKINLKDLITDAISPKRQKTDDEIVEAQQDVSYSIFTNPESKTSSSSYTNSDSMYRGLDLAKRLNKLLYRNHSNKVFFETIKHNIPDSVHILDLVDFDFMQKINELELNDCRNYVDVVEVVFKFIINYFIRTGYISNKDLSQDPNSSFDDYLFENFKTKMFESLNLFLDVAFWTINSIFMFNNEICSKVSYGHLNKDDNRFNLLFDALGLGSHISNILTSDVIHYMFSPTYKNQMILNRICNMEVTPPIVTKYSLINMDRHLTDYHWNMIKNTAFRSCANCGLKPANPIMCLICGSLLCSNNECCHKVKISQDSKFASRIEKKYPGFKKNDLSSIYEEEMMAHAKVCGGGQCVYFSAYHCYVVLLDHPRRCIIPSIYSDKYGNSDLHGKVYGEVKLTRVRLENIINTFCSGRLSNEIVSHRKLILNQFI